MKTNFRIAQIYLLLLFACRLFSQTGLYINAEDFRNGKLSHKENKIKIHEIFHKNLVEVKTKDSTIRFNKNDLFGYQNKNESFRFVNNEALPIINPTEKILFYKKTTGTGLKDSPITDHYFFSKDALSQIFPLTLRNLEIVFENDSIFEKLIEVHFKEDADLTEYDAGHKMYKLNRLLYLSKQ